MIQTEITPTDLQKNNAVTTRLIYLFAFVLLISVAGFYRTYIVHFPDFKDFSFAHHFHGAIMLIWILMLIAQPVFIRAKKMKRHRLVGRASYFVFPLLLLSFFFVGRTAYFKSLAANGETEALANMAFSGIPDIFFMSTLYGLGIYYRKNTAYHLRFFASIGLIVMMPGFARFLIAVCGFPFHIVPIMILLVSLGVLVWMIVDIKKKRSAFPLAVFLALTIVALIPKGHTAWWQAFAKWIATNLF